MNESWSEIKTNHFEISAIQFNFVHANSNAKANKLYFPLQIALNAHIFKSIWHFSHENMNYVEQIQNLLESLEQYIHHTGKKSSLFLVYFAHFNFYFQVFLLVVVWFYTSAKRSLSVNVDWIDFAIAMNNETENPVNEFVWFFIGIEFDLFFQSSFVYPFVIDV